ncbi:MAG: hypothetical protein J0I06_05375 [Planctomycetes bacterium]|nr:hypothetical protein [Planctomycetota bacterium]
MTLWYASHTSAELLTTAAVVAKTVYLAAGLTGRLEMGLGLDLGAERAELDTSG